MEDVRTANEGLFTDVGQRCVVWAKRVVGSVQQNSVYWIAKPVQLGFEQELLGGRVESIHDSLNTVLVSVTDNQPPPPPLAENWREFFPLEHIRQKQERALDFVYRMIATGVKDIIIAAPTGSGKTAIGATIAFWAGQQNFPGTGAPGAYYLCTQKLLQDQLENDIMTYPAHLQSACSLKTSSEYECPTYGDCGTGSKHTPCCRLIPQKTCTYKKQVAKFLASDLAVTNYPYFFTERTYVGQFPPRKILICDECHTTENQLLKFVELTIGRAEIEKFMPLIKAVPPMTKLGVFAAWVEQTWLPKVSAYLDSFGDDRSQLTPAKSRLLDELQAHIGKVQMALDGMTTDPRNWVYWQEDDPKSGGLVSIAKPLSAASYFRELLYDAADVRIYMSAYTGSKDIFCRTLGLDTTKTAMLTLGSVFPKEHRPIIAALAGSMSKGNQPQTLPHFLRMLDKIMSHHSDEKGIIHCNSYALGTAIYQALRGKPNGHRLLFPTAADQRENVYRQHRDSRSPTVILSPSFTEGFDFANDAARWQLIAKCPYPYLGDRQVAAKKDADSEWYAMRTVMTVIQASGRICRNETDHGVTYITDSDFELLWSRYEYMFPNWWKEALEWH